MWKDNLQNERLAGLEKRVGALEARLDVLGNLRVGPYDWNTWPYQDIRPKIDIHTVIYLLLEKIGVKLVVTPKTPDKFYLQDCTKLEQP